MQKQQSEQIEQVTLARLEAVFQANDWAYELREFPDGETKLVTGFMQSVTVLSLDAENIALVASVFGAGVPVATEQLDTVTRWANNWNQQTIFGTAIPFIEDNELLLRVDTTFNVAAGLTDKQLHSCVELGISAGLRALDQYVEEFNLKPSDSK